MDDETGRLLRGLIGQVGAISTVAHGMKRNLSLSPRRYILFFSLSLSLSVLFPLSLPNQADPHDPRSQENRTPRVCDISRQLSLE